MIFGSLRKRLLLTNVTVMEAILVALGGDSEAETVSSRTSWDPEREIARNKIE